MNKIYKVVWNTVRNCYVVGSELISSKSGRHSTSNGKSSSLKVTLTVLALCGMTALGSGVAPTYAADMGATTARNQYVALKYDSSNNQHETYKRINGTWQTVTVFNGQKYIKVNSGVTDTNGRLVYYWVREGYSLTMVDGQPYTSLSSNGRRADVSWTGDANAKPSDILESVTSTHVQTNVTTNVGEKLQQVNAGTYAGVTNAGGTEVAGTWDYIVKDSSWKGVVDASNYSDDGYANLISEGKPKGFVTTGADSKLAWNATLNAYTYNGKVVDYSNIYVIDGEIGVFTNASGSEVYTGTVFGKCNEVLMTVKKSDGKYYSYWGAEVNDAGATMDTYRVAEYQKDLNGLRDNDFALYHNDIKSVDMSTNDSSATISLMRNGDGTSSPAVDGTLTITNGGGADGKDTYVRISHTTNGQAVSKDFTTGSKVEAVGTKKAITALKINGETYNITTDVAKATTEVNGGTNIASVDKTTGSNGNDVYTVNAKGTTVSTDDNFVLDTTAAENNVTNYGLSLANSITIGKGESSHPIVIDGNKGEITGLTNKTLNVEGFATKGRAATEEQLSAMQSGLTAADKYVTSGTIDKANGTMKLTVANVTEPVSITGLTDYQVTQDGSSYDAANHRLTLNLKDTMNTSNPAQSVTFDGIASMTDVAKATTEVKGGTNIASVDKTTGSNGNDVYTVNAKGTTVSTDDNFVLDTTAAENNVTNYGLSLANSITIGKGESSHPIVIDGNKGEITGLTNKTLDVEGFATKGRAATEEQLKAVDEKAAKAASAKTIVEKGKNMEVTKTGNGDGSSTYTVGLADNVSLGNNAIQLNGSDGSISATSGTSSLNFNDKGLSLSNGKNSTVINGGTITVNGGESVISGTQATFGKIKLNAESGSTITGLSNTTTKYDGFATAGRAATEEQLKEVAGKAGEAVETAGKGWNLTTNGKESSKTNIKPDGTVDFSSGNDNLVISNAGANLSFSLSDNLDLTNNKDKKGSVKVGENTALTDELLQVGKDVSLTASALNVGNSSLTTSALTVGNSMLTTDALTVGGHSYITSSGINANNMRITSVAAGINGTDAVNVNQLKSAISGSQVSIKAGDGITVEKTGNQYTIKTNIKGGSTSTGTVTVTTEDNTSTSSGGSSKLPLRQMAIMETAEMAAAEATTTDAGKAITIANTDFDLKFKTDAGTTATVNNGGTVNISGDDVNVSTSSKAGTNSDTIRIALNKDIKVDSITAKTDGGQLNIKSEVNMNSQKITNLAEGDISETSTDAVTGSQLYNTNQAVIANAENINSLSHSLNKLDSRINRVGAGAAALAALHPLDFDPDNKWDFAAGYGNYAGANAVAIGTYYRPNENTMFSIGGSFGGGENMINAGVSFKLGSGGSGITTSKTVMAKKIKEQDELLKAQDAKMKEQDEKIAKLEALVAQQGEMIQQALGKK